MRAKLRDNVKGWEVVLAIIPTWMQVLGIAHKTPLLVITMIYFLSL